MEIDVEGFNDDSGFLSDSTPLKKRPQVLPTQLTRKTVKRRLFDQVSPSKRLKREHPKFKFESEVGLNPKGLTLSSSKVESIVKHCRKMKAKLPSGSSRSPGSPQDNWCFSRIKPYIRLLKVCILSCLYATKRRKILRNYAR